MRADQSFAHEPDPPSRGTGPSGFPREDAHELLEELEHRREPAEWPPELHDADAEREAAWCDRCGIYHGARPCEN